MELNVRADTTEWREAAAADLPLLGQMNYELIQDEGHRNPMSVLELQTRLNQWLETKEYRCVVFESGTVPIGYALLKEHPEGGVYLRQFFISRRLRRYGFGRRAMHLLLHDVVQPGQRVTLECLSGNATGLAFWRAVGFQDYAVTLETWT